MTIEKLPSGNYRVRQMVKGIKYSLTFDYKPTKSDIAEALAQRMQEKPPECPKKGLSFEECVKAYAELKKDRISPKYKAEMIKFIEYCSDDFRKKPINEIEQLDVDKELSLWLADGKAYKTLKNRLGIINSVSLKYANVKFNGNMLPEKPAREEGYIPTPKEVHDILAWMKKEKPQFYAALALAAYGLRRGEVLALLPEDIDDDNVVHITKAMVQDENKQMIVKAPKTQASIREVPIAPTLADYIRAKGCVYKGHPNSIQEALIKAQKALGIEYFTLHKLRHYFCTELWQAGVPVADILRLGGWEKSSDVMEVVYRHARIDQDKERRRKVMDAFSASLF